MKKLLTLFMCTLLVFNCFILSACNKESEQVPHEAVKSDSTDNTENATLEQETTYTPPKLPQITIQKATNDPKAMPGAPIYYYDGSYELFATDYSETEVGITVRVKYADTVSDAYRSEEHTLNSSHAT